MPYKVKKQGDKYVVYKKDTGKRVGATAGNKEALRKYLAALHINAKEGVLNEDAASDLEKWSQTPLKAMGAGDPTAKLSDLAKDLVKKGSEDGSPTDDKSISPADGAGSIGLMQLKASQSEVGKEQSLSNVLKGVNATWDGINWGDVDWLVDHMKPGAEITFKSAILGAKTKDGNVVLDGHHRWSQAFMLNPLAKVNVAFADASDKTADQTLKAVHLAILAKTGQSKTKEAKGGNLFDGASTEEILSLFKAATKVDPKTGKPSDTGVAPYVAAVMRFEDISDVKEGTVKAIQRVKFAIEACAKTVVGGAPSRDAMPQADGELNAINADAALAALDSGDINYSTPFVKEAMLRKAIRKAVRKAVLQESKGLWANIRAKRARGEKPATKGSKEYNKTTAAAKRINSMNEITICEKCALVLMEDIKAGNIMLHEAEYQGREVSLGKPTRGDVKKFKVYVKNSEGNVVKVNFGQKGMKIKKNNPARRKSFRARHKCDTPGPRDKPRYWSCKKW